MIFGLSKAAAACVILVLSYAALFTERMNRAVAVMLGAGALVLLGVLSFEQALAGIDFNTIALLTGMMILVSVAEKSGMFQYAAIRAAKLVGANPRGLLAALGLVTTLLSAFLDNVTTVLLIVPVTLNITRKLKISSYPFLLMEIFASNIGGTATLIGDPPNVLIGGAVGLSFLDFLIHLTPVVLVCLGLLLLAFDFFYGRKMAADKQAQKTVMALDERQVITDSTLQVKALIIIGLVIFGFIIGEYWHLPNGTIALFGAALLLALYTAGVSREERDAKVAEVLASVDWTTIFFFTGLFALVYGLDATGVLAYIGGKALLLVDGSVKKAAYLVLWTAAGVSAVIDNIPFAATMIPLLKTMEDALGGREAMMPVWWALSLGSCFGGNGTLIGASANVVVAGIAAREGHVIYFVKFLLWSVPVTLVSVAVASLFLYLEYWF